MHSINRDENYPFVSNNALNLQQYRSRRQPSSRMILKHFTKML